MKEKSGFIYFGSCLLIPLFSTEILGEGGARASLSRSATQSIGDEHGWASVGVKHGDMGGGAYVDNSGIRGYAELEPSNKVKVGLTFPMEKFQAGKDVGLGFSFSYKLGN